MEKQNNIKKYTSTIEQLAIRDIMTGMLNRRGFLEKAPVVMEKARKENKVFAILSADMNHMKHINDEFGHQAGDIAICRMGKAMESLEDFSFIPVHISGDEFLAYGILDSTEEAEKLKESAKEAINSLNASDPWLCDISASFGIFAAVPLKDDTLDQFMTFADRRMYEEKNSRKFGRRKEDLLRNNEKS